MKFGFWALLPMVFFIGCGSPELEVTLSQTLSSSTLANPKDLELLITNVGKKPVVVQDVIVNEQYKPYFECYWSWKYAITTKMTLDSNSIEELLNWGNWRYDLEYPEVSELQKRDSLIPVYKKLKDKIGAYSTVEAQMGAQMERLFGPYRVYAALTGRNLIEEIPYRDTIKTDHYKIPLYTDSPEVLGFRKRATDLLTCEEIPSDMIRLGETQRLKVSNFYVNVDSQMTEIKGQPITFKIKTDQGLLEGTFENLNSH